MNCKVIASTWDAFYDQYRITEILEIDDECGTSFKQLYRIAMRHARDLNREYHCPVFLRFEGEVSFNLYVSSDIVRFIDDEGMEFYQYWRCDYEA